MKLISMLFIFTLSLSTFAGAIDAKKIHLKNAIDAGKLNKINIYLENNSHLVSKKEAKEALHYLNLAYTKDIITAFT